MSCVLKVQGVKGYSYSYNLIALAIACAITGHTRTKSTDYFPNCTCTRPWKCVINYT